MLASQVAAFDRVSENDSVDSVATVNRPDAPVHATLQSHLPSLDGMRAVSILLVFAVTVLKVTRVRPSN